jgi:type I thyroxine 5'-deiodinase
VNVKQGVVYEDPKTVAERRRIATDCIRKLGIRIPALLDGMDDAAMRAYNAWPNRVYLLGGDGIVAFKGRSGPAGISGVRFEEALAALLALPGGGRFTDVAPRVGPLRAEAVTAASLPLPERFAPAAAKEGFRARAGREPGEPFAPEVPALLGRAREFLRTAGLLDGPAEAREIELVPVDADGRETRGKRSRLWRLRYGHVVRNVPLEGDRLDLILDEDGVREVGGVWHRVAAEAPAEGKAPVSSLQAAREAKMLDGVARLVYVLRPEAGGAAAFRPVFRFTAGKRTKDVEVLR